MLLWYTYPDFGGTLIFFFSPIFPNSAMYVHLNIFLYSPGALSEICSWVYRSFDTRAQSSQLRFRSEKIKIEKINKIKVGAVTSKGYRVKLRRFSQSKRGGFRVGIDRREGKKTDRFSEIRFFPLPKRTALQIYIYFFFFCFFFFF